ncbi:MAG: ArsR family transcriptional regulator [Anaerolineae bacterium]|nr:MAG: ArsR family transcriptional regulator [Anaerolineae bacterium]
MSDLRSEINRLHAEICSGLADPTRILILYTLNQGSRNVSELAEELEIPQPTVSRHLKVLRERRMVQARRVGQAVYYSLRDQRVIQALDLLRAVLASNLQGQSILAEQVQSD